MLDRLVYALKVDVNVAHESFIPSYCLYHFSVFSFPLYYISISYVFFSLAVFVCRIPVIFVLLSV
jgi:hypothetical protein